MLFSRRITSWLSTINCTSVLSPGICFAGSVICELSIYGSSKGASVAKSVEHLTLGFSSGPDLRVMISGCVIKLSVESA